MTDRYDLVIVGLGSAGTVAAEFAATIGVRAAVVERARAGGDCLWGGCIPSKALLASARAAHAARDAERFGVRTGPVEVDLAAVWRRAHDVQARTASVDDDIERFRSLGVEVIEGSAAISGPNEVTVDGERVLPTRFVLLCTGTRPLVPDLPGVDDPAVLTTDDLFALDRPPASLVVLGGGSTGVELAQACNRLGIATTLFEQGPTLLPGEEPSLVSVLQGVLETEGVDVRVGATVAEVAADGDKRLVRATVLGEPADVRAEGVLLATGRLPNIEGLGLDTAGVTVGTEGVVVDGRGRTSVRSIYAAGDVTGRYRFTHAAGYDAVRAVRDMFFPGKGSLPDLVPWCTFTDPELAHAGLTVDEAEARHGDGVDVWRFELDRNDRARTDGIEVGALVVVTARSRVVGAHLLAPHAGEMIHELALAIRKGLRLGELADLVHVYPTLSFAVGQLAAESAFEKAAKLRWLVKKER